MKTMRHALLLVRKGTQINQEKKAEKESKESYGRPTISIIILNVNIPKIPMKKAICQILHKNMLLI